jgi:metal-responsive CopG/Arc/MetJ family transcriptional regulator
MAKRQIAVSLDQQTIDVIDALSTEQGRSRSNTVQALLNRAMEGTHAVHQIEGLAVAFRPARIFGYPCAETSCTEVGIYEMGIKTDNKEVVVAICHDHANAFNKPFVDAEAPDA